jgi:hypothetical protein
MKKVFLLYGMVFWLCFISKAQDGNENGNGTGNGNGNKLEVLKIAYITNRLNLSPEEAQRFWPIYNDYAREIHQAHQDANRNGTNEIQLEENILNIRKKYNTEFARALSAEKVNTFFRSEKEFGNFVQREIQRRQLRLQQQRRPIMR